MPSKHAIGDSWIGFTAWKVFSPRLFVRRFPKEWQPLPCPGGCGKPGIAVAPLPPKPKKHKPFGGRVYDSNLSGSSSLSGSFG